MRTGGTLKLTPKQERFVAEYLIDYNATKAAIRAGYSKKTARVQAAQLLAKLNIARAFTESQKRITERLELTAENVLEEIRRVAFCDSRAFFTAKGELKSIAKLDPEQGSALAGFEVIIKNAEAGDGKTDKVHRIKLWDKTRALEMAAKYFGLLQERVDHTGEIAFRWQEPNERS